MKEMQTHLEKLRVEAEECELISKLATNTIKKELFAKLAAQHRTLADDVERTMKDIGTLRSLPDYSPVPVRN
ncbi:hypothetical protein AAFG13_17495 [Bradyrhizobium sp. B124]|uniref:hypothetical protein n=1 Tax=Bradyrhizobium sp. B124 TaxID=3140245 RepID=UPI0031842034